MYKLDVLFHGNFCFIVFLYVTLMLGLLSLFLSSDYSLSEELVETSST
jgi:hypothetical protein